MRSKRGPVRNGEPDGRPGPIFGLPPGEVDPSPGGPGVWRNQ